MSARETFPETGGFFLCGKLFAALYRIHSQMYDNYAIINGN